MIFKPKNKKDFILRPDISFKLSKKYNSMSYKIGSLNTNYKNLVRLFGKPQDENDDQSSKIQMEWTIEDELGNLFSIYSWKFYNDLNILKKWRLFNWSIGGANIDQNYIDQLKLFVFLNSSEKDFKTEYY